MAEAATSSVAFDVLGIRVRFESNRSEVLALAANAFGPDPPAGDEATTATAGDRSVRGEVAVRITILVEPIRGDAQAPLVHRTVGRRVLYGPGPVTAICDPDRREAIAHVATSLLDEPDRLRREVIEALTLSVVTHLDRQPLHAAAVVGDGAALLLCAASGTGKSTLAYAASRAGMHVLADDAVYVQCRPALAIWGRPRALHLQPEAAELFPELASLEPKRLPNGRTKVVVPLSVPKPQPAADSPATAAASSPATARGDPPAHATTPATAARPPILISAGICLLDREGAPGLRAVEPREVEDAVGADLEPGFDVFAATIGEPVRLLAAAGCWRLTLPAHPSDAVPLLLDLMKAASPARR